VLGLLLELSSIIAYVLAMKAVVHKPEAMIPPGPLSTVQNLRPQPRPTEAEPMFSQHSHAVNISDSRGNSLCNIRNPSFLYRKIMPLLRVSVKKDA
jgi:hypothetical protein